jgi:hypothetical protein
MLPRDFYALPQLNATVNAVTTVVRKLSSQTRMHYPQRLAAAIAADPVRKSLSSINQAHAFAAFPQNRLVESVC